MILAQKKKKKKIKALPGRDARRESRLPREPILTTSLPQKNMVARARDRSQGSHGQQAVGGRKLLSLALFFIF
jgi:hypothetical protein